MKQNNLLSLILTLLVAATPMSVLAVSTSMGSSGSAVVSGTSTTGPACLSLERNLGRGSRGGDVESLQSYLAENGDYTAGVTGYFGSFTRTAVMKWQTAHKISATGFVGPLTRTALSCAGNGNGDTVTSTTLRADPSTGKAPLSVVFSASPKNANQYIIEFGDGTNSGALQSHCLSSNPGPNMPLSVSCEISTTHTYQTAGTYTATLSPYVACLYATTSPRCMIPTVLLGKIQITVN